MQRLRSYYDADRADMHVPTTFETEENKNELYCSMCGELFFVDALIFDDVSKAIEQTSENPFLCQKCLDEYEYFAHE